MNITNIRNLDLIVNESSNNYNYTSNIFDYMVVSQ